ncbi:MAG: glycosyltransferase [Smithella sp.]|nr:glycosyltransferase [Smithella sp.]
MEKIKYVGFDDSTGYAIAAKNLVHALRQAGAVVHWTPVVAGVSAYDPYSLLQVREGYENVILHMVPEYYPGWLKFERSLRANSTGLWGYLAWETDKIPGHWRDLLNAMDGIFVPCIWNREVFRACGVQTRIEVLPHISQLHGHTPELRPSPAINKVLARAGERYVFYNIGVWNDRKAPWLLMEAFLSEFHRDEPVVLVLKTGRQDFTRYRRKWHKPWQMEPLRSADAFKAFIKSSTNGPEIIHLDEELADDDIARLHQRGNCFVAISRGEGWGMGSFEAAWWGKPVITTAIGGVLDYLPQHLSYQVKYDLVPVRGNKHWSSYTPDQKWAEPDLSQTRQFMRRVYEEPEKAALKGAQLREYVHQHFDPARIARQCLDFLPVTKKTFPKSLK